MSSTHPPAPKQPSIARCGVRAGDINAVVETVTGEHSASQIAKLLGWPISRAAIALAGAVGIGALERRAVAKTSCQQTWAYRKPQPKPEAVTK